MSKIAYDHETGKRAKLVNAILHALTKRPLPFDELVAKVSRTMRQDISKPYVGLTMSFIRKNADKLGWSVSYSGIGADRHYQIVFRKMKKVSEDERKNLEFGSQRILRQTVTYLNNNAGIINRYLPALSEEERAAYKDLMTDWKYVADKTAKMAETFGNIVEFRRRAA